MRIKRNVCRKLQGAAEPGNTCLTTPGTCESCPEYKKLGVKSQVQRFFNEWLRLMKFAYNELSNSQFRDLEERIKREIAFHRKPSTKKNRALRNWRRAK